MVWRFVFLFLLGASHCAHRSAKTSFPESEVESEPLAISSLGKYQGSILENSYDKRIFAFRGIRYAEPPVGELRFKPAVPVKKHEGIYDAIHDAPACPQPTLGRDPISEDCLFLNVYTTKLPAENDTVRRPVLVYFHSGDFQKRSGRSNWVGPQYFMNVDIVLVTLNYRLGVLGFISTGDKEAPGNLGLKDQVEALKWVKKNIDGFGGDPNSVTIYGASTSGASINAHLVSPLTKGLFHKAIISTGTLTGTYPIGKSLLQLTKDQARIVGCPYNSTSSMMECLKKKPADKLGKSITRLNPFPEGFPVWIPVIEEDFGQERFLTDHPVKLMLEGKFHQVPIIIGYNSDQYSNLAIELVQDSVELQKFDQHFDELAPYLFTYDHDKLRAKSISQSLRKFYFGDKKIDNSSLPQLMNLYNDGTIGIAFQRMVELLARKSTKPIFVYYYSNGGKLSLYHPKGGPLPKGPVLNDEFIYIFYISTLFAEIERNDPEFAIVDSITCKIGNFVSTGRPNCPKYNIKWEPYNLSTQKYLDSGAKPIMKTKLNEKRFAEWAKLFPLTKYDVVQDSSHDVRICH